MKGTIDPIYTVHCASLKGAEDGHPYCWAHHSAENNATRKGCADDARRAGWVLTRAHGWLCPVCKRWDEGGPR